jgi:hypothetical protein
MMCVCVCVCVYARVPLFNFRTNGQIFTKFGMNLMPLQDTNHDSMVDAWTSEVEAILKPLNLDHWNAVW